MFHANQQALSTVDFFRQAFKKMQTFFLTGAGAAFKFLLRLHSKDAGADSATLHYKDKCLLKNCTVLSACLLINGVILHKVATYTLFKL